MAIKIIEVLSYKLYMYFKLKLLGFFIINVFIIIGKW
jgi:hypothetical protein